MKTLKDMDPLAILSLEWEPIAPTGHEAHAGWGEDSYAWDCLCGAAENGFTDLDSATIASTMHLIENDAVRPVTIDEVYA